MIRQFRGPRGGVDIREEAVIKTIGGDVDEVAEKYEAIWQLSREPAAGFAAPRVLDTDVAQGAVVLERIPDVRSIRELYLRFMKGSASAATAEAAFHRAGHVLALLHEHLLRPGAAEWDPPRPFTAALKRYGVRRDPGVSTDPVQLHGDFGFANVLFRTGKGGDIELVVIDPCPDGYSTGTNWCLGPRYVDIGKMLLSIEGKVPLLRQPLLRQPKVRLLQASFLRGYGVVRDVTQDAEACFAYAYGLAACYFEYRYPIGRGLATAFLYNRFRRNFPLEVKLRFHHSSGWLER